MSMSTRKVCGWIVEKCAKLCSCAKRDEDGVLVRAWAFSLHTRNKVRFAVRHNPNPRIFWMEHIFNFEEGQKKASKQVWPHISSEQWAMRMNNKKNNESESMHNKTPNSPLLDS